ncbi:hypothetical protein EDB92DRAFT_1816448 [Lactarius akahatsu]|uniref:DRBM domain-containing protein n=1 Tax=Lactarius akahatsu TaxID=416441 RepID=A0AAD4QDJ6_9AGAM|nr:hypothetical protein EDB92DRAFT_1816448 [Lactarius akahatsu]
MEDIILVTGTHRTRSCTNIAFLGGQEDAQVSFRAKVDRRDDVVDINWQFSRERDRGAVLNCGRDGEDLPEDQCIFIRGFRVTRKLRILPLRLKGEAGPNPDPEGYDDSEESDMVLKPIPPIPRKPPYWSTVHVTTWQVDDLTVVQSEVSATIPTRIGPSERSAVLATAPVLIQNPLGWLHSQIFLRSSSLHIKTTSIRHQVIPLGGSGGGGSSDPIRELYHYLGYLTAGNLGMYLLWELKQEGPSHQVTHYAIAKFQGVEIGRGRGVSLGLAKREAAILALQHLRNQTTFLKRS